MNISVVFDSVSAILNLFLISGQSIVLDFVNMEADDKIRLRLLYTCINRIMSGQMPDSIDFDRLMNDDVNLISV